MPDHDGWGWDLWFLKQKKFFRPKTEEGFLSEIANKNELEIGGLFFFCQ